MLTDEQLAQIERRAERHRLDTPYSDDTHPDLLDLERLIGTNVPALLAEVKRLQVEVDRLEASAEDGHEYIGESTASGYPVCVLTCRSCRLDKAEAEVRQLTADRDRARDERDELQARIDSAEQAFIDMAQANGGLAKAPERLTHICRIMSALTGHETPHRVSYNRLRTEMQAEIDRHRGDATQWYETYQGEVNARDEFLGELLKLLPAAEDTGMDAYDQIPCAIEALRADRDRAREIAVALEQQTAQLAALADQLDRDATDNDATCDERINELIGQTGSWSGRDPDIARLRALVENQRDIAATIRRALGGESS